MQTMLTGIVIAGVLARKRSPTVPPDFGPTFSADNAGGAVPLWPMLMVLAVAAVAALVVYFGHAAKKRRRLGFIQMAAQQHLTYSEQDPFGLLAYPFAMFQRGDGRGIEHVVHGMWQETNVVGFDYWYYEETSNGKTTSRTYYRFECVMVPVQAECARLRIERESFFTRMADALSFHDIQFESDRFNETFNVKADDQKFANDLIDARMMEWLLATGDGYAYEVMGNRALVVGPKVEPAQFPIVLGVARGFVHHVPKVVYSLYPG
jgi:elongation factor P hydroxylase